jgi:hypothetical protein
MITPGDGMTKEKHEENNFNQEKDVTNQVFGEPIEDSELPPTEVIEGDVSTSLNPDEDFTKGAFSGIDNLVHHSEKITDQSPDLTSGDIDAGWEESTATEETSLGENPTPDQDQVDAVSSRWGTDYEDTEELNVERKVNVLEQERDNDDNK